MKTYKKNDNIVCRKIAEEVILVPIKSNIADLESIYTLNEIAARIWQLIDGKRDVEQIVKIIMDEFDVEKEQAERDIDLFLGEMNKIKTVEAV